MLSLINGLLGGAIAAATLMGGLRAIARGEKMPTERLSEGAARAFDTLMEKAGYVPSVPMQLSGAKGGEVRPCPPQAGASHLARCPACGKRWYAHEK